MNTNLHLQTIKSIPVPMYAPCIFEGAFGDVELRRLRKQVEAFPEEEALTMGDCQTKSYPTNRRFCMVIF